MNRSAVWTTVSIAVIAALAGYWLLTTPPSTPMASSTPAGAMATTSAPSVSSVAAESPEEGAARAAVTSLGKALQEVSLEASGAPAQMEEFYGPYVAPDLLRSWEGAPAKAPGRLTSSPWPDRIEISSATKQADGSYAMSGAVVEKTSTGDAGSYPVTLTVAEMSGAWKVAAWSGYPPSASGK